MNEDQVTPLPIPMLSERPLDKVENVEELNSLEIDVAPEKALNNIVNAKQFEVTPEQYADAEPVYQVALNQQQLPKEVHPAYAKKLMQDPQSIAVARKDAYNWNAFSNIVNSIERKKIDRELNNLYFKKLNEQELTPKEKYDLVDKEGQLKELPTAPDFTGSIVPEVAASMYDFGKGVWQGKEFISKATAIGAGTGAAVGLLGGIPGSVAGAMWGGGRALTYSMIVNQLTDSYEQSSTGVYRELLSQKKKDEVNPEAAEIERKALSKGTGQIVALLDTLPIGYIFSKIPLIKKLTSPKAAVKALNSAGGKQFKDLAISLGKSGIAEGFTEGAQEMVQIFTEEINKTWDGSETSLFQGMKTAISKWNEREKYRVGNSDVVQEKDSYIERVGKATVIGTVAGPVMEAGLRVGTVPIEAAGSKAADVVTAVTNKITPDFLKPSDIVIPKKKNYVEKAQEAAETQEIFEQAADSLKNSDVNKNLPNESAEIKQEIFENAGIPHVFFDKESLNKFSDSEEKANMVNEALGKSNSDMAIAIDAPIRMDSAEVAKIVEKYPEFAAFIKKDPTMGTAKEYMDRVQEADKQRAILEAQIPKAEGQPDNKSIEEMLLRDEDIFNEDDYQSQPTFTQAIEGVITAQEVLKVNEAQLTARAEVADIINGKDAADYNKLLKLETEAATIAEREQRAAQIENNPDMTLVEDFLNNRIIGELDETQQKRLNDKQPIFAINPTTVPAEIYNQIKGNPLAKKRNIFSVHGVTLKQAMDAFGQTSAEKFLLTLATTPTRKEALDAYVKATQEDIAIEAREANPRDPETLAKAYNNTTRNHIREMKILLRDSWSAVKTGIKRIALPLPRIQDLQLKAAKAIGSMRVKDLNARQWEVAERRSQRKAINAILKNEVELAFREKENAALASQMSKETRLAIAKINRLTKWIARLQTPRTQAILKQAGPTYSKAIADILNLYNFGKNAADIDNYRKHAEKMINQGKGDFRIEPEVLEWLTTQKSATDLTVDQLTYLVDRMQSILHQAKTKDRLMRKHGITNDEDSSTHVSPLVDKGVELLKEHPDRNPNRIEQPNDLIGKLARLAKNATVPLKPIQFICQKLDQYIIGGFFGREIYSRLDGTGFHQGENGRAYVEKLKGEFRNRWMKNVKKFYPKGELSNYGITKVFVPEFKDSKGLKRGNMRKIDLLVLLTHMGNAENIDRVNNFNIPVEKIWEVLKRELKQNDFDFVQEAVWNDFERSFPKVQKLHKETTGLDLVPTQKLQFEAFGKTYNGGYMPIKYERNATIEKILAEHQAEFDKGDPTKSHEYLPNNALEGVVFSPHTKLRKGSDWQIDLDVSTLARGFDEVYHDLGMRIPVRDTLMILQNPELANEIINVVGLQEYTSLVNYVADETNMNYGAQSFRHVERIMTQTMDHVQGAMAVGALMLNPKSIGMSALTVPQIIARMGGLNAGKHLTYAAAEMGNMFGNARRKELFELAHRLDPTLNGWREGIDQSNPSAIGRDLPKKRYVELKPVHKALAAKDLAIDISLNNTFGLFDYLLKSASSVAAYRQFLAGNADGFDYDTVMKMTPEDRDKAAAGYAAQFNVSVTMASQRLDKSPLQKNILGRIITMFGNEARNTLNNVIGDANRMRYAGRRMVKKANEGDYIGANQEFGDMGTIALRRILATAASISIVSMVTGLRPGEKDDEEIIDAKTEKIDPWKQMKENLTTLPGLGNVFGDMILGNTPLLNAVYFATRNTGNLSILAFEGFKAPVDLAMNVGPTYLNMVNEGLTYWEAAQNLNDKELRTVLNSVSVGVKGFPASAIIQLRQYLEEKEANGQPTVIDHTSNLLGVTIARLKSFIKKNDKPETAREIFDRINSGKPTIKTAVSEAKEVLNNLEKSFSDNDEVLDDEGFEIIKHIESNGKRNAVNEITGAAGLYQMMKGTWKNILTKLGGYKAGLTDDGRFSPEQQEIAMRLLTKDNVRQLKAAGIKINLMNIYIAHFSGGPKAIKVLTSSDKTKLKDIYTSDDIEANYKLLAKNKTVGEFKKAIRDKLQEAKTQVGM